MRANVLFLLPLSSSLFPLSLSSFLCSFFLFSSFSFSLSLSFLFSPPLLFPPCSLLPYPSQLRDLPFQPAAAFRLLISYSHQSTNIYHTSLQPPSFPSFLRSEPFWHLHLHQLPATLRKPDAQAKYPNRMQTAFIREMQPPKVGAYRLSDRWFDHATLDK